MAHVARRPPLRILSVLVTGERLAPKLGTARALEAEMQFSLILGRNA